MKITAHFAFWASLVFAVLCIAYGGFGFSSIDATVLNNGGNTVTGVANYLPYGTTSKTDTLDDTTGPQAVGYGFWLYRDASLISGGLPEVRSSSSTTRMRVPSSSRMLITACTVPAVVARTLCTVTWLTPDHDRMNPSWPAPSIDGSSSASAEFGLVVTSWKKERTTCCAASLAGWVGAVDGLAEMDGLPEADRTGAEGGAASALVPLFPPSLSL